MKKRIVSVLFIVIMLFSTVVFGEGEEFLTFDVNENGAVVVECDRMNAVGKIDIPNEYNGIPVTGISDYAFYFCENVKEVTLPNTVEYIGEWAFARCFSLEKINIPESVKEIGLGAFWGC